MADWSSWLSPKTWLAPQRRRPVLFAGVVVGAALLGLAFFKPEKPAEYKTEAVRHMDITKSISASGTLQAVESVQIGSQVSGQVKDVFVDFNSQVKKGQLLAVIDTAQLQSRVRQSEAGLASAEATLKQAEADFQRQKRLAAADLVADKDAQDADAARAKAIAAVQQARAALQSDRSNLGYAEIRSPIDGIVINRTVDPGNTVAASFSAPNLFIVANDLSRLEIKIMVDEADIGAVREGQAATFTVDAYPDETFEGRISQVRKQPVTSANVVTYEVIALANNPGNRLLPGMTANVDVITEQHPNVLAMPTTGLRWRPLDAKAPANQQSQTGQRQAGAGGGQGFGGGQGGGGQFARQGGGGRGGLQVDALATAVGLSEKQKAQVQIIVDKARGDAQAAAQSASGDRAARFGAMRAANEKALDEIAKILTKDQQPKLAAFRAQMGQRGAGRPAPERTVYILADNKPTEAKVRVGADDGSWSEIVGGTLKEGDLVIVGGGPQPKGQTAAAQGARPGAIPGMGFGGGFGGRGR
ncbi:MAG TPA: efflux RND transporter periplasmic adaptor subunit [Caulobacterales bacterium]|nr:efflux RND transporter periplasmic adaptor subunit [Caulobacterales bacterium]